MSNSARREELSEDDRLLIQRVADAVVARQMAVPAILFIESSRPLSFVGSQFLYFLEPVVRAVIPGDQFRRVAALLENRDNVDRMLLAIEAADAEVTTRKQTERDQAKAAAKKAAADAGESPRASGWRRLFSFRGKSDPR